MNPRAWIAELVGSFVLTLAVLTSINNPSFPVPTVVIGAVTFGIFVHAIGPVSGSHLNPALTFAFASIGKIDLVNAIPYAVAQVAGALLAMAAGEALFPVATQLTASASLGVGIVEIIGTAFFLFGFTAVAMGRVPAAASGLVAGGSLLIGTSLAAHTSNGLLNPALALGVGSFSHPYLWGPLIGAVIGAYLSDTITGSESE